VTNDRSVVFSWHSGFLHHITEILLKVVYMLNTITPLYCFKLLNCSVLKVSCYWIKL